MSTTANDVAESSLKSSGTPDDYDSKAIASRAYVVASAIVFIVAALAFGRLVGSPSPPTPPDALARWLIDNGAVVDGITIVNDIDGDSRSLQSTRAVMSGEELASLPPNLIISKAVYDADPAVQAVAALVDDLTNLDKLAVFLLSNRPPTPSFWAPFIARLPKAISAPIFWDDDEVAELQVPGLIAGVAEARRALATTFQSVQLGLPTTTLSDFMLSWQLAASRSWGFERDGASEEVLLPLFDMGNHDPNGIVIHRDGDRAILRANRDYDAGVPIHTFYHNTSNFILLHTYGFALGDDHDIHMACTVAIGNESLTLERRLDGDILQLLRLDHDPAADLVDLELQQLQQLSRAVEAVERDLASNIEEDDALLKRGHLADVHRQVVRTRRQEKVCLRAHQNLATIVVDVLVGRDGAWGTFQDEFGDWVGFEGYAQHLLDIMSVSVRGRADTD